MQVFGVCKLAEAIIELKKKIDIRFGFWCFSAHNL